MIGTLDIGAGTAVLVSGLEAEIGTGIDETSPEKWMIRSVGVRIDTIRDQLHEYFTELRPRLLVVSQ